LTTILDLADEPGRYGTWAPILADAARQALAQLRHAPWRISVTHPDTGVVIAHMPVKRRPSAADVAFVRARDRTCRFKGCRRPAKACEIDHTIERQDGGAHQTGNLGPLCGRHHRLKTKKIWTLVQAAEGRFEWRSPLGATYVVEPEPVDDNWQLPADLWDWTEDAEWASEDTPPDRDEPWWVAVPQPDYPDFRHTDADRW
jgi:hypothetical protein